MDEWRVDVQSVGNWNAEFELAWSMGYKLAHLGPGESGKKMLFDIIPSSRG